MINSTRIIDEIQARLYILQQESYLEGYNEIAKGTVFIVGNKAYLITTNRALYVAETGKALECYGSADTGIPSNFPKIVHDFFFRETDDGN